MEAFDLISNYHAKTDDELVRLAADMNDLAPEARELLAMELSRRGIGPDAITGRLQEMKESSKVERQQKTYSLFPSLRRIRARTSDWQKFRAQTGHWPVLSIGFYIGHAILGVGVLLAAVWYSLMQGWSQYTALLVLMPAFILDGVLSDWAERKIRLHEISQHSAMRLQ